MRTLCSLAILVGSCVLVTTAHASARSHCRWYKPADIAVSIDDGVTTLVAGGATTYEIIVVNHGPRAAHGVDIEVAFPDAFADVQWTVSATRGAHCGQVCASRSDDDEDEDDDDDDDDGHDHAGNIGNIVVHGAKLPVGATCTFVADATLATSATGKVTATAGVHLANRCAEVDVAASDTDTVTPASGGDPKDPPSETPGDPKDPTQTNTDPKASTSATTNTTSTTTGVGGTDTTTSDAASESESGGCNNSGQSNLWMLTALLVLRQFAPKRQRL